MDRPEYDPPVTEGNAFGMTEGNVDEQPPTAPLWAYLIKGSEFVPGYDLHPGDTIFLTNRAYPRVLWTQLSQSSWSVLVQQDGRHFRSAIDIDPQQHYVVKRKTLK
jgi:hypothetical protein